MFIFNLYGVFSLAVGLALYAALEGVSPALGIVVGSATALLIDLYLRLRARGPDDEVTIGRLFWPRAGGHVWFIPVWLGMVVMAMVGLLAPILEAASGARAYAKGETRVRGDVDDGSEAVVAREPIPAVVERGFCDAPLEEKSERTEDGLGARFCVDEKGSRQGPYEASFGSGQRAVRGWYVDGHRHGTWTGWHDNGQLAQEAEFKDDAVDGRIRTWNPNGFIMRDEVIRAEAAANGAVETASSTKASITPKKATKKPKRPSGKTQKTKKSERGA